MRNPFRRAAAESRELSEVQIMDAALGIFAPSTKARSVVVNQDTAFFSNAVLACLIVRAETFASLPVHVYSRDGVSRTLVDDPLVTLVGDLANPLMTSVDLWRWKQITEDVRGEAYVYVERSGGRPAALWPMPTRGTRLQWDAVKREPFYEYPGDSITPAGVYSGRDVLHFLGPLNKDAYTGTSLVDKAATAIGLTIASERFMDRLLANGDHFPKHLETDGTLKDSDINALRDQFRAFAGVDSAGEMRIFDRGLKVVGDPMTVKDSDLSAQQAWYLQEVCRVFRTPPPLVQDWSHSTYTNSEQADLWFTKHTIRPICRNSEAVLKRLFLRANSGDRYVKWELDGLLRGDFKTRMEGYSAACGGPFMMRDEVRRLEDMNPVLGFEKPLMPLNYAQMDEDGNIEPAAAAEAPSAQAGPVAEPRTDHFAPIRAEKLGLIRDRAAQDRERGRDESATRAFAAKVVAPLVEAYRLAGRELDSESLINEAMEGTP